MPQVRARKSERPRSWRQAQKGAEVGGRPREKKAGKEGEGDLLAG